VHYDGSRREVTIRFREEKARHLPYVGGPDTVVVLPLQHALDLGAELYNLLMPIYSRGIG
jgi:hypothetical protein